MNGLTLGSLFDGIGGFPLAAQRCGIRTLWASEIETNCIAVTKRHFPEMQHLGSITEIDGGKIPPVDIISFGSPCQDLSVAGRQSGLDGERSGLFREAVRIIYEMWEATNGIYPAFIIWENVPGAFGSNKGKDFRTVLEEITKSGISMPDSRKWARAGMVRIGGVDIAWRQMDAQYWGIPQRRKRIFLVADFRGRRAAEILFKPESLLGYSETGAEAKAGVAAALGNGAEVSGRNFRYAADALQCTYETAHASAAHSHAVFACYPVNEAVIHGKANGFGIGEDGDPAPTLTGRDRHAVAFFAKARFDLFTSSKTAATILATTSKNIDGILLEAEKFKLFIRFILRKLTPLECERLQGFPDEWTRYSDTGEEIKDTPRYVALGNSLAVPCAERVFRGIISAIGGGPGNESG
ncbi:DNA cytosine methyltransferase [Anaerotruncus colihominis]|uniref:DNA cytosine methyltransferase n=1 Tax=Anaerotruncus colihominis TaxID=169435 RepID=UPI00321B83A5